MHRSRSIFVALAFSLAVSGIGTTASAQVPQCADTFATAQEDSVLGTTVECTDGGHLGDVTVDHVATVAGSGLGGWAGDGEDATAAALNLPNGVFVDRAGNLFVADSGNHLVRRVDAVTGVITTIAGMGVPGFFGDGGAATGAGLNDPRRAIADALGNVFVADIGNSRIRRIDVTTGVITTVAGGGPSGAGEGLMATEADFIAITGIAFDSIGDLFVVEVGRSRIRRISGGWDGFITGEADERIFTIAGTGVPGFSGDGGPALSAQFSLEDIAFDQAGNLFIADRLNHRVRRVTPGADGFVRGAADEIVTTIAGGGALNADGIAATDASLNLPRGVAVDRFGNVLVSESGAVRVRRVDAATGTISTVAGGGSAVGENIPAATARVFNPRGLATDAEGNLFISELGAHRIRAVRLVAVTWTYEIVEPPSHGLASMTVTGTLVYGPDANFAGSDVITFRALNAAARSGDTATIAITVTPINDLPIADAGPDQTVGGGEVRLDGTASSDPDGTPLTFSWAFTSRPPGSNAVLQNQGTPNPTFTPDVTGAYVVQLTVTDTLSETARDSVTVTATVAIPVSNVALALRYLDEPPSATGAVYWVEGHLVSRTETVRVCQGNRCRDEPLTIELGRIHDSLTRLGVPVGEYDVQLRYRPGGSKLSEVHFEPRGVVQVKMGQVTSVLAELRESLGRVEGEVTLNGEAPDPGLKLCVVGIDRSQPVDARLYTWCMDLDPAQPEQGRQPSLFNLLLPAGEGRGSVCRAAVVTAQGQCEVLSTSGVPVPNSPPPLASFVFHVLAGDTTGVTVNVVTSEVRLALEFNEVSPSATGAAYWVEGELVHRTQTVRVCEGNRCRDEPLTIELGRVQDSLARLGVPFGEYDVKLRYRPGGPALSRVRFEPSAVVRVQAGQVPSVLAELRDALGRVEGEVTVNGEAPLPGLKLCVVGIDRSQPVDARLYTWCMDLDTAQPELGQRAGLFKLLLPPGEGRGSVCQAEVVAAQGQCEVLSTGGVPVPNSPRPLASFVFHVVAGDTTGATVNVVTSVVDLRLGYHEELPSTRAAYWVEGQLVSGTQTVRVCEGNRCRNEWLTIELGRIHDSITRLGAPVGEYDVRLRYLPGGPVIWPDRHTRAVVEARTGEVTSLLVELEEALGEIEGEVTLNGEAPGPGLKLCIVGIDRNQLADARLYTWCMDLDPTQGSFRLLLPAGEGRGSVCHAEVVVQQGQCEVLNKMGEPVPSARPPLARFDFQVEAGTTRGITIR